MRIKYKIEVLKLSLSTALVLLFFSPIIAAEILDQKKAFQVMATSFVEPVGIWTQENDDFEEGAETPRLWLGTFNWGPSGQSVLSDVFAVSGENACTHLSHFTFYFDSDEGNIQRTALLGNGKMITSPIEYTDSGEYVSVVKIMTPDGEISMKDTATMPDENTRKASAHFLNVETGNWDFSDTKYWHRAGADFKNPCE